MDNRGVSGIKVIGNSRMLEQEVGQFMQQWFMNGAAPMINNPRSFYEQGYHLYTRLFADYSWDSTRRYLLIPDGIFSYLPFDALVTHAPYSHNYSAWPFLFKRATLSQAYSLQTWYQQQSAVYSTHSFAGFFVSKGKGQAQPALAVRQEYQSLQARIKGSYYLDSNATWGHFTDQANGKGIVHISSHAVSSAQDSFPYLQFYDQPFYLFDLRYRSFAPALVVLGLVKRPMGPGWQGRGE
ncbi:CHAT domain-containing protein [Paraflavitalea speifideaquila]|uniref:CHAT domain-containing protein n=1 Tax=Paraflavitalea speifideaquila TaxID=3076558 RepID=UPI0028E2E00A|nr:CHAT domain-containing protein [Paraflavitalea speifideiaquila]